MTSPAHRLAATDVAFKTSTGRAEVVRRALRLTSLERALLIVADGRQDFAGLLAALGRTADGDIEAAAALNRLMSLGLLDVERPGPATSAPRRSLALARLYLIDCVERALRGQTDALQPLLRDATDEAGVLRALVACEQALHDAGAARQAGVIRARCLELLP
jgi:hypothetical protein